LKGGSQKKNVIGNSVKKATLTPVNVKISPHHVRRATRRNHHYRRREKESYNRRLRLNGGHLAKAPDRAPDRGVGGSGHGVRAASQGLLAALALPDANNLALDGVLAAEGAGVGGVLRDLRLLDLLTNHGTVAGTVLAHDSDLLRATSHFSNKNKTVSYTQLRAHET
jgi:hypothetical protein